MPKRASAVTVGGKWTRRSRVPTIEESEDALLVYAETSASGTPLQSDAPDQTDFGATQVGPGSLPVPSVDPETSMSVPSTLFELPFDATEGEHVVEETLPKSQAVGPGFGRGSARSKPDHIYINCEKSCPEDRRWDGYGLQVPQQCSHHCDGMRVTYESADVWACYVPNFLEWQEFQDRYNPFKKLKQAVDNCQFWSTPPGAMTPAVQVNGKWTGREQGEGERVHLFGTLLVYVHQAR